MELAPVVIIKKKIIEDANLWKIGNLEILDFDSHFTPPQSKFVFNCFISVSPLEVQL